MVDISFLLKLRNLGFATSEDMEIIDTAAMAGEPEELGPEDVFMKTGVYSGSEEMVVEEMDRYIDLRIHVYNDRKLWKCFDNTCTDFSNSNDVFALRLCNNRSRLLTIAKDAHQSSDFRLRADATNAINALGKMGAKEYAGDIAAIIKDNNINGGLRENAIDALGKMGARTELTRLFDDAEIPERLREEIHNKISLALDE